MYEELSTQQMLERYNAVTGKRVKRFPDRATAERRLLDAETNPSPGKRSSPTWSKSSKLHLLDEYMREFNFKTLDETANDLGYKGGSSTLSAWRRDGEMPAVVEKLIAARLALRRKGKAREEKFIITFSDGRATISEVPAVSEVVIGGVAYAPKAK